MLGYRGCYLDVRAVVGPRHEEFLKFLKQVAKAYPHRKLHIVCDNYATHNTQR